MITTERRILSALATSRGVEEGFVHFVLSMKNNTEGPDWPKEVKDVLRARLNEYHRDMCKAIDAALEGEGNGETDE